MERLKISTEQMYSIQHIGQDLDWNNIVADLRLFYEGWRPVGVLEADPAPSESRVWQFSDKMANVFDFAGSTVGIVWQLIEVKLPKNMEASIAPSFGQVAWSS